MCVSAAIIVKGRGTEKRYHLNPRKVEVPRQPSRGAR